MSEQLLSGGGPESDSAPVCPWCSAPLPSGTEERCPSCGASLHEADTSEIPGVTRIDHEALLRAREPEPRSRGLIGWLSGEYEEEAPAPPPPGTLEPPDDAVRREMMRLELAALEVEVHARQVEAIVEAVEAGEDIGLEGIVDDVAGDEVSEVEAADADDGAAGAATAADGETESTDDSTEDETGT
jgi:hypothetical protein